MENNAIEDVVMDSVTPYSNWELLNSNDNPNDRFNCFIMTAVGLLGFGSVRAFEENLNTTQYVISKWRIPVILRIQNALVL